MMVLVMAWALTLCNVTHCAVIYMNLSHKDFCFCRGFIYIIIILCYHYLYTGNFAPHCSFKFGSCALLKIRKPVNSYAEDKEKLLQKFDMHDLKFPSYELL